MTMPTRSLASISTAWLLACTILTANAQQTTTSVQSAVDQYAAALQLTDRSEQLSAFKQSQQLFRQALESYAASGQQSSPELWLAFANASLQSEQLGWAILGYRRALLLDPTNDQAAQNLRFARSLVSGWQPPVLDSEVGDTLFFWRTSYSQSSQNLFAASLFFTAGLCAALAIALSRRWFLWIAGLLLAAWSVFCVPIVIDALEDPQRAAVIVADEAVLRTADTPGAPERLSAPIPGGAELKVISSRDDWFEVEIPQGSGWLRSHEIRNVDQPFD